MRGGRKRWSRRKGKNRIEEERLNAMRRVDNEWNKDEERMRTKRKRKRGRKGREGAYPSSQLCQEREWLSRVLHKVFPQTFVPIIF